MIEARQCIFKEAPDKKYTTFMDKVMDTQYSNTMAELNRFVPTHINKRSLNYNNIMKNIHNILYPPENKVKRKSLTKNEMLKGIRKKKAFTRNKKGGERTRKRRD